MPMHRKILAVVFLVSLLVAARAAQSPSTDEPIWMMEVLKVQPGMFGATLGYLDNDWMRIRAEAKREGAVLTYYRIADQDSRKNDQYITLLTEFKNAAAFDAREKLFSSIRKQLPDNTSAVIPLKQTELFETVRIRVFQDYSDPDRERFRLLSKN
jgi:hypothetical protein